MTADAVGHFRCRSDIDGDGCCMVMTVAIKVGAMALDAGAASATVDGSVAMPVDADSAEAVSWVMT